MMKKIVLALCLSGFLATHAQDKVIDITITQPASALSITNTVVTDLTANGFSNGAIDITVSGGTSPYTYSWSNGATSQDLTGIPAGNYQVIITDNNGCQETSLSIPVTQPPAVNITVDSFSGVSCNGDTDGSITVSATGGYQDFQYALYREQSPGVFVFFSNSPVTNSPYEFTNLIPDVYRVEVTDNSGAGDGTDTSGNISINEPAVLQITGANITNIVCTGASTGAIDVSVSGGTSPYTYSWSNGATSQDLTNVPAGVYTLNLTDANGCQVPAQFYEITEPADALSVSTPAASIIIQPTFAGASDGQIDIFVSGGTSPYNYSWSNGAVTQNISGLPEGFYTVTITDSNGCTAMETYELIEPEPLIANIQETQVILCNGDSNGELTVNATGGVTEPGDGYDFSWTKTGDPGFSATTQTISGINTGEYNVEVTDNNGITTSASYTINEPAVLSFNYTQVDNLCFNGLAGSIEMTPAGGTAPYMYSIDNGDTFQAGPLFPNLPAGNYTLVVEDAYGCSVTQGTAITQPEELLVDSVVVDITAYQYDDGSISIDVSGGTAPYSFDWFADNGFTSSDEDIANLGPGNYTLVIQDANYAASGGDIGCSYTQDFTVIEPEELLVNVVEDFSLLCFGDSNGELFADATGGVIPWQYEWFSVSGGVDTPIGQTTDYATNLSAGQYRVIITDANDIQVISQVYDLQQPDLLVIQTESTTDILCYGDATGAIDVSILGGTPPYTIDWNNGAVSEDISQLTAGDYSITVTDDNGCVAMETISLVNLYAPLDISDVEIINASTYDAKDGSISLTLSGGAVPYTISWVNLANGLSFSNAEDIAAMTAGDYEIIVRDAFDCTISASYTITQPDLVDAVITAPLCHDSCEGSIELIANEGNNDGSLSYFWDNGSTGSILSNVCAGTYTVTIVGYNDDILLREYEVVAPEALTVDLGADRTLCTDQVIALSAAVEDPGAVYSWTSDNGFVSNEPVVDISEAGTYSVTVINSNGCQTSDDIVIQTTVGEINAEFLVATQAFTGEPVVLVDISYPVPDAVEWILPDAATVVDQQSDFAELVFDTPGEYEVGIITRRGVCEALQIKTILVIDREYSGEGETGNSIDTFITYPNPSNGNFSVEVALKNRSDARVRVFGLSNNTLLADVRGYDSDSYVFPFYLGGLPSGLYAIVLETPFGSQVRKIIIE